MPNTQFCICILDVLKCRLKFQNFLVINKFILYNNMLSDFPDWQSLNSAQEFINHNNKIDHRSYIQIYSDMKSKLNAILQTFISQKEEYQYQVNLAFQMLKKQYSQNLQQKNTLISQLKTQISQLNAKSQQIKIQFQSQLELKQKEIIMLRSMLKNKYMDELTLESKLKDYHKKQKVRKMIKQSCQNIQTLLNNKKNNQMIFKTIVNIRNKKQFQKDTQKTRQSTIIHKYDTFLTPKVKKRTNSYVFANEDLQMPTFQTIIKAPDMVKSTILEQQKQNCYD